MKVSNPKVSVIVPVHNVEKFLRRCIDSIISQTLHDIEIIAVNDGSTDSSIAILREYEERDPRIFVINQENRGVSNSRNKGIEIANGEYIAFVDSDDWISSNMLETLYSLSINNNCDIVLCSYIREYEDRALPKKYSGPKMINYDNPRLDLYRKLVGPIGLEVGKPENLHSLITVWGKLYRTSIIKQNNVKFIDMSLIGTEDYLFNVYVFKYINKAIFLNEPLYHYWKGNTSSITTGYNPKLVKQWEVMYQFAKVSLASSNVEELFYKALDNRICLSTLNLGLNECSRLNKLPMHIKIKSIKKILNTSYIEDAFKGFELRNLPVHWRVYYFLNKFKLATLSYLMLCIINAMRKIA